MLFLAVMALLVFRVLRVLLGCLMFLARLGLLALRVRLDRKVRRATLALRVLHRLCLVLPVLRVTQARLVLLVPRVLLARRVTRAFRARLVHRVLLVWVSGIAVRSVRSRSLMRSQVRRMAICGLSVTARMTLSLLRVMCGMRKRLTGFTPVTFRVFRVWRVLRVFPVRRVSLGR